MKLAKLLENNDHQGVQGPSSLNPLTVTTKVEQRVGNYALGRLNQKGEIEVCYVGRSDSDIHDRLMHWTRNSTATHFWFSYAQSPAEAYKIECQNFHRYSPVDNEIHPAAPEGTKLLCPRCGK